MCVSHCFFTEHLEHHVVRATTPWGTCNLIVRLQSCSNYVQRDSFRDPHSIAKERARNATGRENAVAVAVAIAALGGSLGDSWQLLGGSWRSLASFCMALGSLWASFGGALQRLWMAFGQLWGGSGLLRGSGYYKVDYAAIGPL